MKYRVIEKIDGEISEKIIDVEKTKSNNTRESLFPFAQETYGVRECEQAFTLIQSLFNGKRSSYMVYSYYEQAFKIKNKKELVKYIYDLINFYYGTKEFKKKNMGTRSNETLSYYIDTFDKVFDYSATAIVRRMIYDYYKLRIKEMNLKEFNDLLSVDSKEFIEKILNDMDIKYNEDNGLYQTSLSALNNAIKRRGEGIKKHLCMDCALYPYECTKLHDADKQELDKYPYITDGYQEWKDNPENPAKPINTKFLVYGCNIFRKMK